MSGTIARSIGQWYTWIPTLTGFSADPTSITARYTLNGNMCTVRLIDGANGTSNATTKTYTLPFAAKSGAIQAFECQLIIDNGTTQTTPGHCRTASASNILTIYKNPTAAAFTASGNCRIWFTFTYEIA